MVVDLSMRVSPVDCRARIVACTPAVRPGDADRLSFRVQGYFPFPRVGEQEGATMRLLAWIFKDTHQAVAVRSSASGGRLLMDFMTEGGASHPVWWDERVKWGVLLGSSIRGEVRIRRYGARSELLERLERTATGYGSELNLYTSNCRIFCARMRREAERLNAEAEGQGHDRWAELAADARLAVDVVRWGMLPLAYPASVLVLCWEGLKEL